MKSWLENYQCQYFVVNINVILKWLKSNDTMYFYFINERRRSDLRHFIEKKNISLLKSVWTIYLKMINELVHIVRDSLLLHTLNLKDWLNRNTAHLFITLDLNINTKIMSKECAGFKNILCYLCLKPWCQVLSWFLYNF